MSTDLDSELAANVKAAKTKRMHFAFVPKGTDGALVLAKSKVPPALITVAKKKSGGSQVIEGVCFGEDGKLVFETDGDPPATMEATLKKVIQHETGITQACLCRPSPLPVTPSNGTGSTPQPTSLKPQSSVPPQSPPTPPKKEGVVPPTGGVTAPVSTSSPQQPQPHDGGLQEKYLSRRHIVEPQLLKAIKENHGDVAKFKNIFSFALERAEHKEFDKALQGLESLAKLLETANSTPVSSSSGSGTTTGPVPQHSTPPTPTTGEKTVPTPTPKPRPVLRQEVPDKWEADKIVTNELFDKLLDVHAELFDGNPPTNLPGVSFAIVDKMTIGTAYVKAQVWDEKEDGVFNPAKNKEHAQMALEMAPAMVTIIPSKDPNRTVYVNDEYFERNGGKPNYDEVNAVMLHEAHHASSKGFVNYPFFDDHDLSWGFDECATEYFTKKVWDSKYPDKKDDYFKYTNYFKDAGGKKGWYGEAGAKLASALGEKTMAAAYFSGGEEALKALKLKSEEIKQIVKTVK